MMGAKAVPSPRCGPRRVRRPLGSLPTGLGSDRMPAVIAGDALRAKKTERAGCGRRSILSI